MMLMRCAARAMAAPAVLGAGLVAATGLAAAVTFGAGLLLAQRFREERQGWREGASDPAPAPAPAPEPPTPA
jgi:hypothetical protein